MLPCMETRVQGPTAGGSRVLPRGFLFEPALFSLPPSARILSSHYPSGEMEQLGESETSRVSLVPAGFRPSSWLSFLSVRCPAPDQPPVVWGHGV